MDGRMARFGDSRGAYDPNELWYLDGFQGVDDACIASFFDIFLEKVTWNKSANIAIAGELLVILNIRLRTRTLPTVSPEISQIDFLIKCVKHLKSDRKLIEKTQRK